jgi:hypothetical protein
MDDLTAAHMLTEIYDVTGVGPTLFGKNGGGDPYYTDGELRIGVLSASAAPATEPPKILPNPPAIAAKDAFFARTKQFLDDGSSEP